MTHSIVKTFYEDPKNSEEELQTVTAGLKIWEEKVLSYFPEGHSLLDIGCGLGREAFALYQRGYPVTGIDISSARIKQAMKLAAGRRCMIPFLVYDGRRLPFEDASFDIIILWAQTFGLLYGTAYKQSFLRECRRVLKSGGILSYSGHDYAFLTKHYSQYLTDRRFYPFASTRLYWEAFTSEELTLYARRTGFTVLECKQGEIYKPEDGIVLYCVCRK